jgi:peptidoglycan-associated lipoprotein
MNIPSWIHLSRIRVSLFFLLAIFLIGCSSTEKPKPQESKSQPQQQTAVHKPVKSPVSRSGSSLDAHREGKVPASGPLKDIYFDFDQSDLRAEARDILRAHAKWLKDAAAAQVEIEGHCDERGTGEYNLALGAKRAHSAKEYLMTLGVPANHITTTSYGKELPVCNEHTEDCWQRNRRDRFVVKNAPTT